MKDDTGKVAWDCIEGNPAFEGFAPRAVSGVSCEGWNTEGYFASGGAAAQVATSPDAPPARRTGRFAAAYRRTVALYAPGALPGMALRAAPVALLLACSPAELIPAALAQTTLVSNTGQSTLNLDGVTHVGFELDSAQVVRAQRFTTGSNPAGYTLSSASFLVSDWTDDDAVEVSIKSDSSGSPGSEIHVLSNPPAVSDGLNMFSAPSDAVLAAGTDYFVHFRAVEGSFGGSATLSANEDSGSAAGWSIGDSSLSSTDGGASWSASSPVVRMRISGTANNNPHTGSPTISGTALTGQTLTASKGTIADIDGLSRADNGDSGHAYRYRWVRVDPDGTSNPTEIVGAVSSTYTVAPADEGKRLKVRVSFSDDGGNEEEASSDAYPMQALPDTTPPTLGADAGDVTTYGSVIGKDIHLYFSEAIGQEPEDLPAPDAFFITVDGVSWLIRPGSVKGEPTPTSWCWETSPRPSSRGRRFVSAMWRPRQAAAAGPQSRTWPGTMRKRSATRGFATANTTRRIGVRS